MNENDLIDQAANELPAAMDALDGGFAATASYARAARELLDQVTRQSRDAMARAAALRANDEMNPQGRARLLSEIPGNLMAATSERLSQAELNLELIEDFHLGAILRHDHRDDANLRFELGNYVAGMTKENAVATMVGLAANPRYATFLSGPMGDSIAARFDFKPEILRETALNALAVNGSPEQVARSRALAALPAARRVHALAKAARDFAVENVRRPAPVPTPGFAL